MFHLSLRPPRPLRYILPSASSEVSGDAAACRGGDYNRDDDLNLHLLETKFVQENKKWHVSNTKRRIVVTLLRRDFALFAAFCFRLFSF